MMLHCQPLLCSHSLAMPMYIQVGAEAGDQRDEAEDAVCGEP